MYCRRGLNIKGCDFLLDINNEKVITSPIKAIRAKCLDCCCGSFNEVKECAAAKCPLYEFRLGKNPYRTHREISDEEKAVMTERLKRARELKQK